jgi:regulator of replication initiation timing
MQLAPTSEEAALEMKHLEASEQARPKSSEDHSDFGQKEASEARPGKEEGVVRENHQQAPAPRMEGGDVRRRDTEPPEKKPSRNTASETGQPRQGRHRTEERLSQPSRRNHSAAPTGKPLSRPAPEEQAPQGRSSLFSAFRTHTRKPNAEEQANYLHEQCETLKAEKAALMADNTALMAENEALHGQNTQLRRMVHELRAKLDMAQSEYLKERQQLKGKLDGLTNAHVQSVSSVGTGLEPISDQTFDDRFRALRDNVRMHTLPNTLASSC